VDVKAVKWGVLGVSGHFLKRVLLPLQKSELVELYALASRSAEKAREAALRVGIPVWYGSYQELLADKEVEAVYIPLPNHLHAAYIRLSAEAGKQILCEKPLALSAAEAAESIACAATHGVRLMEGFMYRFHPQWQRARELVACGEIGSLQFVHTVFGYNLTDPRNIRSRLETGGGALRDIGCYAVSAARYLSGKEPERVISLHRRDPAQGTDTLSSGMLDFGAFRCLFTVSTGSFPAQRVDVHGSGGSLTVQLPFNTYPDVPAVLTVRTSVGVRDVRTEPVDQYALQFEAFSRALREDAAPPLPPEDARRNQVVLDALFRSEETGNWERPEG
jgi:predicted dehydrogenase